MEDGKGEEIRTFEHFRPTEMYEYKYKNEKRLKRRKENRCLKPSLFFFSFLYYKTYTCAYMRNKGKNRMEDEIGLTRFESSLNIPLPPLLFFFFFFLRDKNIIFLGKN